MRQCMYACMCVTVRVYVCLSGVDVCVCLSACRYVFLVGTCSHICLHACKHVCMHTCAHACTHVCTYLCNADDVCKGCVHASGCVCMFGRVCACMVAIYVGPLCDVCVGSVRACMYASTCVDMRVCDSCTHACMIDCDVMRECQCRCMCASMRVWMHVYMYVCVFCMDACAYEYVSPVMR